MNNYNLLFDTIKELILSCMGKSSEKFENHITAALAVNIYDKLINQNKSNNLAYHNINHILYMLEKLHEYMFHDNIYTDILLETDYKDILIWSILFHDYVYDPLSETNEIDSGDAAEFIINNYIFDTELSADVRDMILTTNYTKDFDWVKYEKKDPLYNVMITLHDLDWAIFGDEYEEFSKFDYNVCGEYILAIPTDKISDFMKLRKTFLENALEKHKKESLFKKIKELNKNVEKNITRILKEKYSVY